MNANDLSSPADSKRGSRNEGDPVTSSVGFNAELVMERSKQNQLLLITEDVMTIELVKTPSVITSLDEGSRNFDFHSHGKSVNPTNGGS